MKVNFPTYNIQASNKNIKGKLFRKPVTQVLNNDVVDLKTKPNTSQKNLTLIDGIKGLYFVGKLAFSILGIILAFKIASKLHKDN